MTATSIDIDRPADEVFAYVTDPTRFHEWQQGVVSGGMKEPGTPTVGSHCTMSRRIGGTNQPSTSVVTKMNPPTNWAVHGIDGPIRAQVDVTVQALDEAHSRVSIDLDFQGHGIGKLLVPLVVRRQAAKEMPANVQRLKNLLESSPA
ncbi:MAG: SRPBCC family protein [Propionibacteriales bacterium]|nr:SRPBCC family protein [Propionibacteriales bacterium]